MPKNAGSNPSPGSAILFILFILSSLPALFDRLCVLVRSARSSRYLRKRVLNITDNVSGAFELPPSTRPHAYTPTRQTALLLLTATVLIAGCAPLSVHGERAARSSLGCMKTAIDGAELGGLPDKQQHCIAAGLIAQRCSMTEAMLASVGKEIQDLFGPGNAESRDIAAGRAGIRCAKGSISADELIECCRAEV